MANHTLWDAVRLKEYGEYIYETAVLMPEEDYAKLKQATLPEGRELLPFAKRGCSALYGDVTSTMMNYRDNSKGTRPVPGVEISLAKFEADGGCTLNRPDGKPVKLDADPFAEVRMQTFEKTQFPAPAKTEDFISKCYPGCNGAKGWVFAAPVFDQFIAFLPGYPPDKYLSQPSVKAQMRPVESAKRKLYRYWNKRYRKPREKKIDRYRLYLQRTEDRFDLWEHYYPLKARIRKLVAEDPKGDELGRLLRKLVDKMAFYYEEELGFGIDQELLDACVPFLQKRFGKKKAQKMIDLVPREYLSPGIEDILRKRGVDHPLLKDTGDSA